MKHILLSLLALMFATLQIFAQTYTYDNLNRLTKVVYRNGTTISYSFDALGNRTSKKVTGATSETYIITTSVTPEGSGTVTGGGIYSKGSAIELKAIANAGYEFEKWSDGVTDNPRSVTVNRDKSYSALFVESTSPTNKWYLVAHKAEGGSQNFAMDNVGSLVAIDDAIDFSVLDVNGNVLASQIIKVTFRHGYDGDGVETLQQPNNFIGMVNGKLTIIGVTGPVAVYDISGVRFIQIEAQGNETVVNVSKLPTGIYVVRTGTKSFKFIKK